MPQYGREFLYDRIYACWMGKNIGGSIGTPYEGTKEMQNVTGFQIEPGKPLPNDDLDLQLVWLRAVDELGPDGVNANALAQYWLSWIGPHWNEYGNGKSNLREGFLPPLSGEVCNDEWKHSNGAWIRTEVWACLYPLQVEKAIRFAFEDASVDHGYGEGTNAAIFIAAMESAAFAISDIRTLLKIGLSKIPSNCRVAHSVRIAIDAYDSGKDWQTARNLLVQDSEDLGWFQAPANIGYVVIGMLYGEGDFKKTVLTAINCGDDTDCTGATVGALMGIKDGLAGIPEDWREYIGDDINTCCILNGHGRFPASCTQLTEAILNLLPVTMRTKNEALFGGQNPFMLAETNDFSDVSADDFLGDDFAREIHSRKPHSFCAENLYASALLELDRAPVITPEGTLSGNIKIAHKRMPEPKHFRLRWILPEGWWVEGHKNLYTAEIRMWHRQLEDGAFVIHAGENVEAVNRVVLEVSTVGRPEPLFIPITIMG